MNVGSYLFFVNQIARDLKAAIIYPFWVFLGKRAPDNHFYKKKRIKNLALKHSCESFIETGTFYGQMLNFSRKYFSTAISIEIYEPLHKANENFFKKDKKVKVLFGDSSKCLPEAIRQSNGKILFWLDGHYSGLGTGRGLRTSPIIEELKLIAANASKDNCIIIDDLRLFTGENGYPTVDETICELKKINSEYLIHLTSDCIVAEPKVTK